VDIVELHQTLGERQPEIVSNGELLERRRARIGAPHLHPILTDAHLEMVHRRERTLGNTTNAAERRLAVHVVLGHEDPPHTSRATRPRGTRVNRETDLVHRGRGTNKRNTAARTGDRFVGDHELNRPGIRGGSDLGNEDGVMSDVRVSNTPTTRRYSKAQKDQAVRLVQQLREETGEHHGAVVRVARQLGFGVESVREWVVRCQDLLTQDRHNAHVDIVVEADRRYVGRVTDQPLESLGDVVGVNRFSVCRGEDVTGIDPDRTPQLSLRRLSARPSGQDIDGVGVDYTRARSRLRLGSLDHHVPDLGTTYPILVRTRRTDIVPA
jgi:transposase-like protein